MQALRMTAVNQPLEMQDIPVPQPGPRDVLVKVKAAGICHSDAHYRAGVSPVDPLPLTLGHEVAGIVELAGGEVTDLRAGDRVCLHYLFFCGECAFCRAGTEQFCPSGKMIGKYADGGYAEYIRVPAASAFRLPDSIPFEAGAVMMCSTATSYHALKKARMQPGESVAVIGIGGLGISAVQLAIAMKASQVFAVDIQPAKLRLAAGFGAIPINSADTDPVKAIKDQTDGRGVDVSLELIGLVSTTQQCVRCLAPFGRAALAGICGQPIAIDTYREVIAREAEIIGVSDHLASEIPDLLAFAESGQLDYSNIITRTVPLDADIINAALNDLEKFGENVRTVIIPS